MRRVVQKGKRIAARGKQYAQSAMEYLMSYGWTLVVIVVAISILSFLGVFTGIAPESCVGMPSKFPYKNHVLTSDGTFYLTLINSSGKNIEVTQLTVASITVEPDEPITVAMGEEKTLEIGGFQTGNVGDYYSVEVGFVYNDESNLLRVSGVKCTGNYEPQQGAAPSGGNGGGDGGPPPASPFEP